MIERHFACVIPASAALDIFLYFSTLLVFSDLFLFLQQNHNS